MRKVPEYDWTWLRTHAPFKKILEDTCELEVEKENIPYRVIGDIWSTRVQYNIELNYAMLQDNFSEIKRRLLNTRICKHNKKVCDWISQLECSKGQIGEVITRGCLIYDSASFKWDWKDGGGSYAKNS